MRGGARRGDLDGYQVTSSVTCGGVTGSHGTRVGGLDGGVVSGGVVPFETPYQRRVELRVDVEPSLARMVRYAAVGVCT